MVFESTLLGVVVVLSFAFEFVVVVPMLNFDDDDGAFVVRIVVVVVVALTTLLAFVVKVWDGDEDCGFDVVVFVNTLSLGVQPYLHAA